LAGEIPPQLAYNVGTMRKAVTLTQWFAIAVPFLAVACVITTAPAPETPAAATASATPAATTPAATAEATPQSTGRKLRTPGKPGQGAAPATATATTTATTTATATTTTPAPSTSTIPGVTQQQCVAPAVWDGTKCTIALPPGGRPPGM
jgi:hypothetical protein